MLAPLSLLLLAGSALAVSITKPSAEEGWTSTGPNEIVFSAVSTDPTSWDVLLVNQNKSLLASSVTLVTKQDAATTTITISPVCGSNLTSYPVGEGYQVNFVNTTSGQIVTQSNQFNITQGSSTATCASTTAATTGAATTGAATTGAAASASGTAAATGSAFASSTLGSSAVVLAFFGFVGAALL
ncbi:hypothetical protein BDY24DRAFT_374568 [Mrakia frigida]|uniref:GPI anchored serine-threonine rich family protein n=1 Tax=Mrakia frigida TaxID=29902 RepID=UPI003FCC22B8